MIGMTDEELALSVLAVGQQDALKYEIPRRSRLVCALNFELSLSDEFIDKKAGDE